MTVLVDSSVWIDLFNGIDSPERRKLAWLLEEGERVAVCGPVVAEVLQGARRSAQRLLMLGHFHQLPFLEAAGIDLFVRTAEVYRSLREKGITVRSLIDCLIATLAERHGCLLLARDRDLRAIAVSGVVGLSLLE